MLVLSGNVPFMNMVWIIIFLPIDASSSMVFSTSYLLFGLSTRLMYVVSAVSSLSMGLSVFISASRISLRCSCVLFDSTLTFALGQYLSRSIMTSSMISGKWGLRVGSPFPAKVSTSGICPNWLISISLFSSDV